MHKGSNSMTNFPDLINKASTTISSANEAFSAAKLVYEAAQKVRWKVFLYGCKKSLGEAGVLESAQELKLKEIFESDFSKKKAYDFIRSAIEANSEVSRIALARLFVTCSARTPAHATYDEQILLQAYQGLDDQEIEVFLFAVDSAEIYSREGDQDKSLEMTVKKFAELSDQFKPLGCSTHHELRDLMESFATRKLFTSTVGLLGSETGDCFSLVFNRRSERFIEDLRWARTVAKSV